MKIKFFYDKIINWIYDNRIKIVRLSISALGAIFLVIVLYFSSDNFNVNSQADTLVSYIENRKYDLAQNYYEDLKKEFSDSKMNSLNKKTSKKLTKILVNNSDKFINGEITREQYMGLINMINSLKTIEIDSSGIIDSAKRVDEMYMEENITYDSASSYFQISSMLRGVNQSLDEYKQHIKVIYESREVYKSGTKYQSVKKYHEAIEQYDKVLKEDSKYYSLAQNAKKECINVMYDYYLSQVKSLGDEGKYEEALKYLSYLKPYYDEEKLNKLEDEYNKYIEDYTMTSDDITSLIARRSGQSKNDLSIMYYLQTINGERYYYAEVMQDDKVIDEVLINTKTKQLYSYKSDKKDYNCNYSDAYFKIDEMTGEVNLSISNDKAKKILENQLNDDGKKYKSINELNKKDIKKYSNEDLESMIEKNGDVYYYFLVKNGWFKPKEFYVINIYTKEIYIIEDDEVEKYH